MQNYVPAGNGDASGEYGDNETGSNKHFTNFKKPDGETTEKKFADFKKPATDVGEKKDHLDIDVLDDELDDLIIEDDVFNEIKEDDKVNFEEQEKVIKELDENETKKGIVALNPDLDKEKVAKLSDKEAEKLLKAINYVDDADNKLQKIKSKQKKIEGIWYGEPKTIAELYEQYGGKEGTLTSIQKKEDYFNLIKENYKDNPDYIKQSDEKIAQLQDIKKQLDDYVNKTDKIYSKLKKSKDLIAKYEDVNGLYSQERKDKALWCKSMAETKKNIPSITKKGCTQEELDALYSYTQSYSSINEPLRNILYGNKNGKKHTFEKQVKAMTSAINKSVFDKDIWVQRGTNKVNFPNFSIDYNTPIEKLQELVGTKFEDQAFVSTGGAKGTGLYVGKSIMLNIYCQKGTKGAYVADISAYGTENEIILQRGYSYKVQKVEKKNGIIYMDVDCILGSDENKYTDAQLKEIAKKNFI